MTVVHSVATDREVTSSEVKRRGYSRRAMLRKRVGSIKQYGQERDKAVKDATGRDENLPLREVWRDPGRRFNNRTGKARLRGGAYRTVNYYKSSGAVNRKGAGIGFYMKNDQGAAASLRKHSNTRRDARERGNARDLNSVNRR